jgi:hypothetical protein
MLYFIKTMNEDWIGRSLLLLFAALFLSIPAAIYFDILDQKEWDKFYAGHDCKIVGHVKGGVLIGNGIGVTYGGKVGSVITTTIEPDKNGYACNDGVTYWR